MNYHLKRNSIQNESQLIERWVLKEDQYQGTKLISKISRSGYVSLKFSTLYSIILFLIPEHIYNELIESLSEKILIEIMRTTIKDEMHEDSKKENDPRMIQFFTNRVRQIMRFRASSLSNKQKDNIINSLKKHMGINIQKKKV